MNLTPEIKKAILGWFEQCSDGCGISECFGRCGGENARKCKKALEELGLAQDPVVTQE